MRVTLRAGPRTAVPTLPVQKAEAFSAQTAVMSSSVTHGGLR